MQTVIINSKTMAIGISFFLRIISVDNKLELANNFFWYKCENVLLSHGRH